MYVQRVRINALVRGIPRLKENRVTQRNTCVNFLICYIYNLRLCTQTQILSRTAQGVSIPREREWISDWWQHHWINCERNSLPTSEPMPDRQYSQPRPIVLALGCSFYKHRLSLRPT